MKKHGAEFSVNSLIKDASGAALIELSLLLLPLTGLMVGAVEYGRVFQQFHVASKGVTAASRYLARLDTTNLCPGPNWPDADELADAKDLAQRGFLEQGSGAATASHILPNWNNHNDITVVVSCADNTRDGTTNITQFRGPAGTGVIPRVTVSTTFTYDELGLFKFIDPDGVTVRASHTELYIGG
ncbi:MAG: hypothetical protein HKO02_02055 [Hyphomonadaceae bacterium]|nr:hypothetical protein [Hyphomonadaceae bacterium]